MSLVKDQAVAAARRRDFGNDYVLANGLAMDELLGALAAIATPPLAGMTAQSGPSSWISTSMLLSDTSTKTVVSQATRFVFAGNTFTYGVRRRRGTQLV